MSRFFQPRWLMLWVALAAFALYLPSLGHDFVYDSLVQVTMDDFIHQPRHWADCLTLRVLGMDVLDFNRPLNLASLMADAQLWGKNPAGFRLTNLLLHAAVAALLCRWLWGITGNSGAAFFAALVFAVHPLHTETVVEVGYREDLLVTLFMLAALNAAAAFKPCEEPAKRVWGFGLLTLACLFLAAASKESGIAGPVVLGAYWALLRREPGKSSRAWIALIAAAVALVGAFYALRFGLEPKHSVIFDQPPQPIAASWIDWFLAQSRIWTAEALRVVWPARLCADYGPYNLSDIDPIGALLVVFSLGIGVMALPMLNRRAALGCVLTGAALLPTANLLPIYRPMADRYLYLPMTGLALLLALALARPGKWQNATRAAAAVAAALLAAVTLHQAAFWRDGATLWAATARVNPFSTTAWAGQGDAALEGGRFEEALAYYQKADRLAGGKSATICGGLALAWDGLHEHGKAAEALRRATKLDSRFAQPETLVRALVYYEYQARHFSNINLRLSSR